jgi:hypothetical protein
VSRLYVRTIPPEEATGRLQEIYEQDRAAFGFVPPWTQSIGLHLDALVANRGLGAAIRSRISFRRYELVTAVVASLLHCST